MILNEHAGTHDMYLPDKRAKKKIGPAKLPQYVKKQISKALEPRAIIPDPKGSREQKELWMRERQALKRAELGAHMESDLLQEAYHHLDIRRRTRKEANDLKGVH